MTHLLGTGSSVDTALRETDNRALSNMWRADVVLCDFGPVPNTRQGPWWPGGGGMLGDVVGDCVPLQGIWWDLPDLTSGQVYRFGVTGVTRDVYGSPLGGVTVKLFRTSTDEMVGSVVSDPSGNYFVTSPYYPDAHYLVTYKTGTPDVFGTSANTLVGG